MNILKDSFGRTFPYIRMSITDVCNFKCGYCLPNGYQVDKSDNRKFLHLDEIRRLAKCFSELGVNKIRITGGEPTVRKDFFEIIKVLKFESGIKKVAITTNGYHLDKKAKLLVDSGLNGINISIDSLNQNTFKNVTGHDRLPEILKGIENLQNLGFNNIKINAVLLKNINSSSKDFNEWIEIKTILENIESIPSFYISEVSNNKIEGALEFFGDANKLRLILNENNIYASDLGSIHVIQLNND
mgnify:CR=1 FL=1